MKKIIAFYLLWRLFIPLIFSQNIDHTAGGHFVKRIEFNLNMKDSYNLNSKIDIEKLFWGNMNASVEFFYDPSGEMKPCVPSGFRIVKDSLGKFYILEVKYISNYREAAKEADNKFPSIGLSFSDRDKNLIDSITKYNRTMFAKRYEEMLTLFKVETLSYHISDSFAEKFYEKMVSFIGNFKAKGVPGIIFDGYAVTFRTVVDDEVWSLFVHMPQGNALKWADFCRQIITDAISNQFNEANYIQLQN